MTTGMSFAEQNDGGEAGGAILAQLPAIILQRKWLLIIPAILVTLAGVAAAFLLPVKYQSKATLLVEAPMLADVGMNALSADEVSQRMAKIEQQVLSRPELIELIQTHGLYRDELQRGSLSDVVAQMRSNIRIGAMNADVRRSGNGRKSTIAFSMSFDYSDPVKAQAVAQALTERVLELDSTTVSAQAENTVQFLSDQAAGLQEQIGQLESEISGIKERNGLILSSGNMAFLGGGGSYDTQIAMLQRENERLNSQRGLIGSAAERDPVVSNAEAALAAARAMYADSHPDVIMAKQRLDEARRLAARNQTKIPTDTIDSQIAFNNRQISMLQSAKAQETSRMTSAIAAQSKQPVITQQIAQLQGRLDGLNAQYRNVSDRLFAARAGQRADEEQQGERLSVIDPPVVPETAISPDRPKLILGGLAGGLALGFMAIFGLEIMLRPIRDVYGIQQILGEPPLVAIPTIKAQEPRQRKAWFHRMWPFGGKGER